MTATLQTQRTTLDPRHRWATDVGDPAGGFMGSKEADVAVVLVHGIGSQTVGATPLSWAEPIIKELPQRISSDSGAEISFGATQLDEDPASTTITFTVGARGNTRSWKFIEARWASSFPWPGAGEVLRWAINFIPRAATRIWHQLTRPVGTYWAALDAVADTSPTGKTRIRFLLARAVLAIYSAVWFLVTTTAIMLSEATR